MTSGQRPVISTEFMINPNTPVVYNYQQYKVYASTPSYVLIEDEKGKILQVRVRDIVCKNITK